MDKQNDSLINEFNNDIDKQMAIEKENARIERILNKLSKSNQNDQLLNEINIDIDKQMAIERENMEIEKVL